MGDTYKINPFTGNLDNAGSPFAIGAVLSGGTYKAVLFVDSAGQIAQEPTNLLYDPTKDTLNIVGSSDNQRLILKANATQTINFFEVQDSSGNILVSIEAATATRNPYLAFPLITGTLRQGIRFFRGGSHEIVFECDGSGNVILRGTSGATATCFTASAFDGSVIFGGDLGTNTGMIWGPISSFTPYITCRHYDATRSKAFGVKTYKQNGSTQIERFYITADDDNASGADVGIINAQLNMGDACNIIVGTSTGTKIGTSTSQKLGLWNTTPVVQPTTAGAAATFVANTSAIANDTATFDGYTIGQVVKALRNIGILA